MELNRPAYQSLTPLEMATEAARQERDQKRLELAQARQTLDSAEEAAKPKLAINVFFYIDEEKAAAITSKTDRLSALEERLTLEIKRISSQKSVVISSP